jgi:hypothetical protein
VELLDQQKIQELEEIHRAKFILKEAEQKKERQEYKIKQHKENLVTHEKLRLLWENEYKEKCEEFESFINKETACTIGLFDGGFLYPRVYPREKMLVSQGEFNPTTTISFYLRLPYALANDELFDFPYSEISADMSNEDYKVFSKKLSTTGYYDDENAEIHDDIDSLLSAMKNFLVDMGEEMERQLKKAKE